ncbi:hypothetical protein HK096_007858, partial [Nowakowskiella sp. JEL0078]
MESSISSSDGIPKIISKCFSDSILESSTGCSEKHLRSQNESDKSSGSSYAQDISPSLYGVFGEVEDEFEDIDIGNDNITPSMKTQMKDLEKRLSNASKAPLPGHKSSNLWWWQKKNNDECRTVEKQSSHQKSNFKSLFYDKETENSDLESEGKKIYENTSSADKSLFQPGPSILRNADSLTFPYPPIELPHFQRKVQFNDLLRHRTQLDNQKIGFSASDYDNNSYSSLQIGTDHFSGYVEQYSLYKSKIDESRFEEKSSEQSSKDEFTKADFPGENQNEIDVMRFRS